MKRLFATIMAFLLVGFVSGRTVGAEESSKADLLVEKSRIVVEEMLLQIEKEKEVPIDLIRQCSGLAIIPGMVKGSFFVGGAYGQGVVLARRNGQWTAPAFISLGAGSFGIQFGGQSIDLIMVVIGDDAMEFFTRSKFKLGADIGMVAGPVGAQASAAEDILLKGGVFSYSRSRGLFMGISLEGAGVASEYDLNKAYYQTTTDPNVILAGKVEPPASAQALIESLNKIK
jgi:lipid-binding SYLF domain-containing protein